MIETGSETWREIAARIAEQIEEIRDKLELESTDELRTTQLRARSRAFKDVLKWANAAPDESHEGPDTPWQL